MTKAIVREVFETMGAIFVVWMILMILYWLHTWNVWLAGLGAAAVWVLMIDKREDVINKEIELQIGDTVLSGKVSSRPGSPSGPVPTPPGNPRNKELREYESIVDPSTCPYCGENKSPDAWTCCDRMAEGIWKDK